VVTLPPNAGYGLQAVQNAAARLVSGALPDGSLETTTISSRQCYAVTVAGVPEMYSTFLGPALFNRYDRRISVTGVGAHSTLGGTTFLPGKYVRKINKMPEF